MNKFKNIETCWTWVKQNAPQGVTMSKMTKVLGIKAFEFIVPKSVVKAWPKNVKEEELVYTISEEYGDLYMFCEETNTNWDKLTQEDLKQLFEKTLKINESCSSIEEPSLLEALQIVMTNRL